MHTYLACFSILVSLGCQAQSTYVTIDNSKVFVQTINLEKRKAGQPVVIFESGMGTPLDHWDTILAGIAESAPVVAYDRPGIGKSEPDSELPTLKNVANKLRRILKELEVKPPYILVGHSLGGVYVRGFAVHYPQELIGMVMIDPADFTETYTNFRLPLKDIGQTEAQIDAFQQKRMQENPPDPKVPQSIQEEGRVLFELRKSEFTEIQKSPLPAIPVHIIVGGRFEVPPDRQIKEFNHEAFFRARTRRWIERYTEVVNAVPKGMLFYSAHAGHFVHRDDPQLVISSVQLIIADAIKLAMAKKNK